MTALVPSVAALEAPPAMSRRELAVSLASFEPRLAHLAASFGKPGRFFPQLAASFRTPGRFFPQLAASVRKIAAP
jgi:hypothetical protein